MVRPFLFPIEHVFAASATRSGKAERTNPATRRSRAAFAPGSLLRNESAGAHPLLGVPSPAKSLNHQNSAFFIGTEHVFAASALRSGKAGRTNPATRHSRAAFAPGSLLRDVGVWLIL